jgi:hypothetical protein
MSDVLLPAGVFLVALLYSSVGHAGASGYIAVMSLLSLAPSFIKPGALVLNILVATIASLQFWRAGHFRWALFWPFALAAVPLAFVGGFVSLPRQAFQWLLGAVLLYSAWRLLARPAPAGEAVVRPPRLGLALLAGGGIGLLSGLTGTGGGIFLTPLLLFAGWAAPKQAAAVSALFILLNSASGLGGWLASGQALPAHLAPLLLAAGSGGLIGSWMGARQLAATSIKRFLALVLLIAGLKLLLS